MTGKITGQNAKEFTAVLMQLQEQLEEQEAAFLKRVTTLSTMQLKVLRVVATSGPCTMGAAARCISSITLSRMSTLIDQLVKLGYVSRMRCDHDRRVVRVMLTQVGHELHTSYESAIYQFAVNLFSILKIEEQEVLLKIYRKFRVTMPV